MRGLTPEQADEARRIVQSAINLAVAAGITCVEAGKIVEAAERTPPRKPPASE